MQTLRWLILLTACLSARVLPADRPNVVFMVADDLGYGDLGCFGQTKIRTPNLDRLAAEGMRFTQHYAGNAVCAPSRCVLLTGLHPGHAFIRDNRSIEPEGQLPIPAGTVTLTSLLRSAGQATGGFGKWGLGGPGTAGEPLRQGFQRWYGFNCQAVAHNYYPTYLWDDDRKVALSNPAFSAHARFEPGADPTVESNYARFQGSDYAPDLIAAQAREFVRQNRHRPFFLYWPTTVPHLALQVPRDSLAEYVGKWDDPPYLGDRAYLPQLRPRATYAAMITRMDREIGRLMDLVRELGLEARTLFVFTSDNGPLYDKLGGTDSEFFNSNGGLRGRKGSLYEGGVRVPCIVRWKGRIAGGSRSDRITGFEDWLPTLLDLTGLSGTIPKDLDGISFAPTLLGRKQAERRFLYREFPGYGGQQSVRVGDWKAIRQNLVPAARTSRNVAPAIVRTELYHLAADPTETRDLSGSERRRTASLERILLREHRRSAEFPIAVLDR